MDESEIEIVRRTFGGFARLIRDDAEAYIGWLLGIPNLDVDFCTGIFLAQTGGSKKRSEVAWADIERATESLTEAGFLRASEGPCSAQIGHGNDFVYVCGISHEQCGLSMHSVFDMFCSVTFPSRSQSAWRSGFGISIHTAYVALSHAKENEMWADDAFSVFETPNSIRRQLNHSR
tara:strand:+ start:18852 stop:19379 length:528 start_codon:yes stop_codon:yes gene_type:complete